MKKNGLYRSIMTLLFAISIPAITAYTQDREIHGIVKSMTSEPLAGVFILEEGTSNGATTDIDGRYSIVVSENAVLVFSCLGYEDLRRQTGKSNEMNIVLKDRISSLDEVVVVAYGAQKKVNVTGSISSIREENLQNRGAVSNVMSSLQGTMPGVVVTRSTSAVGREGWNIKVRGAASINDTEALVIIDGVPGSMDDINPDDIESISVLKDASAAIYGARAAGGVILITTKRGEKGKIRVTYKGSVEIKVPSLQVDYLNASEYAYIFEEGVINDNSVDFFKGQTDKYGNVLTGINTGSVYKNTLTYGLIQEMKKGSSSIYADTVQPYSYGGRDIGFFDYDYNDLLWDEAVSHSHSLAVTGGSDKYRFSLSLGYMNDGSMLKIYDENSTRYNIRLNNDYEVSEWLSISASLSYDMRKTDYATYNANAISGLPVGSPMETPNGLPYSWGSQTSGYGLSKWGGSTRTDNSRFALTIQPTITFFKGFNLVFKASLVKADSRKTEETNRILWYNYSEVPSNSGSVINPSTDSVSKTDTDRLRQEYQVFLNYLSTFRDGHNFSAMLGSSYEDYRTDSFTAFGDNLSTGTIHSLNTAAIAEISDDISSYALASAFARINYDYKEKYLLEMLGRYDGSSKFARGHRWQPFFGISAGWNIAKENFMLGVKGVDNLKLRLSYGETGNQAGIGTYDAWSTIDSEANGNALIGDEYVNYIKYAGMVSLNRSWERICTGNAGLDFGFLGNRLIGSIDIFNKVNRDMLISITYPEVLGATAPETNSGTLKSSGWEVSILWRDDIGKVIYWIGGNISDSRNILVEMEGKQTRTWNGITRTLEGYPLNTIWGLEAIKLIETEEELTAYRPTVGNIYAASNELQTGDVMYKDLTGDGEITKDDVKFLGDIDPHYSYAFNFGLKWNGLDFSCIFQGVGRQMVVRSLNATTCLGYSWYQTCSRSFYDNHWTTVREKCEAVGDRRATLPVNRDSNAAPRIGYLVGKNYNYLVSDAWWRLQNAAYLRLKNLVVGYTLPQTITRKAGIDALRFYIAGNDLLTFCNVKDGYDPENTSWANGGEKAYTSYPFARSFICGIDITF